MKTETKQTLRRLFFAIWSIVAVTIMALLMAGCKTVEKIDNSRIEYQRQDSVRYIYQKDTTYIDRFITNISKDSSVTKQNESTRLEFGSQGGTYNALTGIATNVTSVTSTKETNELKTRLNEFKEKEETWILQEKILKDSITNTRIQQQNATTEKTSLKSGWKTWLILCGVSFILGVLARFLIKKGLKFIPF